LPAEYVAVPMVVTGGGVCENTLADNNKKEHNVLNNLIWLSVFIFKSLVVQ
jgi:hypothetical protein